MVKKNLTYIFIRFCVDLGFDILYFVYSFHLKRMNLINCSVVRLVLFSLFSLGIISCSSTPTAKNREVAYAAGKETSREKAISDKVYRLTNTHRSGKGKRTTSEQAYLKALAKEHSEYMVKQYEAGRNIRSFLHDGIGQRSQSAINREQLRITENVMWYKPVHEDVAAEMFKLLLESRAHRKNLEGGLWEKTGVSTTKASDGTYFSVQLFGREYIKRAAVAAPIL